MCRISPLVLALFLALLACGGAGAGTGPSVSRPTLNLTANPYQSAAPAGTFQRFGSATATGITGATVTYPEHKIRHDYNAVDHSYLGWLLEAVDLWSVPTSEGYWLNPAGGTIYVDARARVMAPADTQILLQLDNGTNSQRLVITRGADRVVRCTVQTADGGLDVLTLGTVADGARCKVAVTYGPSGLTGYLDGSGPVTSTGHLPAGLTTLRIGGDAPPGVGAYAWGGWVQAVAIYSAVLDGAVLAAKTGPDPYHLPYPTLSLVSSPTAQPEIGTYTRASTATFVGSDGLIHTAPAGVLRYEFHPTQMDPYLPTSRLGRGWFFEEQRTNILLYSQQFDNAAWAKTSATITVGAGAAPDGTMTAAKLVEDTTSSVTHSLAKQQTLASGTTYCASVYVQAAGRTRVRLYTANIGFSGQNITVNLSTGAVTGASGTIVAYGVVPFGGGVYRVWLASTAVSSAAGSIIVALADDSGATTYNGDGTSGIYVWGAQLEAGAFPSSYIPTTTAAVTRQADVWTIPTSLFGYRASEGALFWQGSTNMPSSLNKNAWGAVLSDGTTANMVIAGAFGWQTAFGGYGSVASTGVGLQQTGYTPGTAYKSITAYKGGSWAAYRTGGSLMTSTQASVPVMTQINIGSGPGGVGSLNGYVARIEFCPVRMSNTDMQTIIQ